MAARKALRALTAALVVLSAAAMAITSLTCSASPYIGSDIEAISIHESAGGGDVGARPGSAGSYDVYTLREDGVEVHGVKCESSYGLPAFTPDAAALGTYRLNPKYKDAGDWLTTTVFQMDADTGELHAVEAGEDGVARTIDADRRDCEIASKVVERLRQSVKGRLIVEVRRLGNLCWAAAAYSPNTRSVVPTAADTSQLVEGCYDGDILQGEDAEKVFMMLAATPSSKVYVREDLYIASVALPLPPHVRTTASIVVTANG